MTPEQAAQLVGLTEEISSAMMVIMVCAMIMALCAISERWWRD